MLDYSSIAPLIPPTPGKIYIAYSGGIDSQVLLHLCATQAELQAKIVAIYIDHGLQPISADWARHCREQALGLGVDFRCLKVDAQSNKGESPEEAARNARYQALKTLLAEHELLLLGQHREDQLETVLLQLFRGAGVQGLAAMPVSAPFGLGTMIRPLLDVAKTEIQAYAQRHRLQWVEDPTNKSDDFDRNFLRNAVVPLLKQRWPALDKTVARSARHCGEAAELLKDWGQEALMQITDPHGRSLDIGRLRGFNPAQRNWLLRLWFQSFGLRPPSQAIVRSVENQFILGRSDGNPQLNVQHRILKKYRERLFCLDPGRLQKLADPYDWPRNQACIELPNRHAVSRVPASSGLGKSLWFACKIQLKPRLGGERLKLPGRNGQHCLKKLYQEAGIPPWEREARPLLYLDNRLAAVPGLWVAEWAWRQAPDTCYELTWQAAESM